MGAMGWSLRSRRALAGLWRVVASRLLCRSPAAPAEHRPDLPPSSPPVQLEGARGPLSARKQRSSTLASRAHDIFDGTCHRGLVGSPLTTGNQVLLLQDGPATYQACYAAILAARDHINMETYILDDDEVGQRFAQALIDKQRQGVQVNLIRDSVGTLDTPPAFF